MKSLIIYYSKTGNTKTVAELIKNQTNSDIEEITEKKSRTGILGYLKSGYEAMRKKTSEINNLTKDLKDYDLIYIGSPVWGWNLVPAIRSFLNDYKIDSKKLALFCTMGGSGNKKLFSQIKSLTTNCNFIGEVAIKEQELKDKDSLNKKILDWVKTVK
jgi:flavodoxin